MKKFFVAILVSVLVFAGFAEESADEMYRRGCELDTSDALEFINRSATMGHPEAQLLIGSIFYQRSVDEFGYNRYSDSAYWLEKAALNGITQAQTYLGMMYHDGTGVERNYDKALSFLLSAATKNHPEALNYLGLIYFNGQGVEQKYSEALYWFEASANQNDFEYPYESNFLKKFCKNFSTRYIVNSQFWAGYIYYFGQGVDINYEKALSYLFSAAKAGESSAQYLVCYAYFNGQGIEKNASKAFEWAKKSAGQGNPEGQYTLGLMYENGTGTIKSKSKAISWYEKAASQGNTQAKERLEALNLTKKKSK